MSVHCIGCSKLRVFCAECGEIQGLTPATVCMKNHGEEVSPSFEELESCYRSFVDATKKIRPVTLKSNIQALHSFMAVMGYAGTQNVSLVTEDALEEYVGRASERYSVHTVKSVLESLHNFTSAAALKWYKANGFHVSELPTVQVKAVLEPWHSLSVEDRRRLRDLQFEYSRREDPRLWLMFTFAWEHGMRKSDVLRLSWDRNFVHADGRWFLDYAANKTGKIVHWPIDEDTWRQLCVARERMRSLRVRHLGGNLDSVFRLDVAPDDEVVSSAVWNWMCADLRRIMGWHSAKAGHNLRKDATDQIYQHYGIDYAEAFSGDTAKILRKHYVGRKRIDVNVVSIAKL